MFSRTAAIAFLTVRSAVRSRVFISLVTVLLLTVAGLPIMIKGDGTAAGQVRILLYYTLGLTAFILGAATLWISCGAISGEIKEKHIRLVAVKPVRRFELWLGKWLGLLFINAVLLCFAGSTVYVLLHWTIRPSKITKEERRSLDEEILVGRRLILPRTESVDEEAHKRLYRLIEEGKISADTPHDEAFALEEKRLLAEKLVVAPGSSKQWVFDLPERRRTGAPMFARFSFYPASREKRTVYGIWNIGTKETPDIFSLPRKNYRHGRHRFSIPGSAIPEKGPMTVRFTNAERDLSNTIVFGPGPGIELLILESTFEINMIRAIIIIFCQLALLAALGLTAGSLLSLPVATFAVSSVLAICMMSHYFLFAASPERAGGHNHGPEPEPSVLYVACEKIIEHIGVIAAPAMQFSPLGRLTDGILVSWRLTGRAVLLLIGVYPGVLGLIGGYVLKRRELALPG